MINIESLDHRALELKLPSIPSIEGDVLIIESYEFTTDGVLRWFLIVTMLDCGQREVIRLGVLILMIEL